MREKCHSCGENAVIYNEEQRCEICCYCGVVGEVCESCSMLDNSLFLNICGAYST